ncbi:hypothetical protein [Pseudopedobacter beijingensis]|uniref:Complex I intermediate-associated protein 30 (CIA30) n=1 Tax=Pseudopedobacter beijingensis TaxID=1207056 RepID=A0ABW4IDS6_9SPHI
MKKQRLLILFVSMLFAGVSLTSCKKDKGPQKQEEEQKDDNDNNTDPTLSEYLQGSDYYLITLDETSKTNIASKVKKDYRTDDHNMWLYVWENTYGPGTSSGPNAFGEVEGWTSLVVANPDWSGCGFATLNNVDTGEKFYANLSGLTDNHVLHFAMKSKDNATHQIILNGNDESVAKITIGTETLDGVAPYGNFTRNGEWHHFEIPMSYLKGKGLKYTGDMNTNVVAILSGGGVGKTLDIDGIFFYKPKSN